MRRSLSLAIALLAVAALAAPAAATTPVVVAGEAGWVDTGIEVEAGQELSVMTIGQVLTAPIPSFHIPGAFKSASGPGGQDTNPTCGEVYATFPDDLKAETGPCALDDAYFGELIGRIGDPTFSIGATNSILAPASGTIELAANDLLLTYWDNHGAFTVVFK